MEEEPNENQVINLQFVGKLKVEKNVNSLDSELLKNSLKGV